MLITVLSLILATQIIALFIQYRVNGNYSGIGYWLIGSTFMALAFITMPILSLTYIENLNKIANPILVLGHIFLYIAIKEFFNRKLNIWLPTLIFIAFNLRYYYCLYINNSISECIFIINFTIAIISFMITYQLFSKKDRFISASASFIGVVFIIYGLLHALLVLHISKSIFSGEYVDYDSILTVGYVISIISSNLWAFGFIIMSNQRLNIENQLEKEKFKSIFNTNIDAQLITRFKDGLIVDINHGFSVLTGYSRYEVIGLYIKDLAIWNKLEDRLVFTAELNDKGICEDMEFVFQRKDKSKFYGTITSRIIMIHSIPHIISVARDTTARKKFEIELAESKREYQSILNTSPINVIITDLKGRILMISPLAKEMFGYKSDFDGFLGMQLLDFIVAEDLERAQFNILKMYEEGDRKANEYKVMRRDKSIFDIEVNSEFVYSENGLEDKMVFVFRDITELKQSEVKTQQIVEQLKMEKNTAQFASITDSLTGLANRRFFDDTLKTEFLRMKRSGTKLSLIMVDIDYFKKFNDNYGHLSGDKCLQKVASSLKNTVGREPDVVARYGGEEFIVILPQTGEDGAKILGERIRKNIEDLAIPHQASDISKYVTVSVGIITAYPDKSKSPDQILKMVDEALYCAKEEGRNRCCYK